VGDFERAASFEVGGDTGRSEGLTHSFERRRAAYRPARSIASAISGFMVRAAAMSALAASTLPVFMS
jgi:hypothetical protein